VVFLCPIGICTWHMLSSKWPLHRISTLKGAWALILWAELHIKQVCLHSLASELSAHFHISELKLFWISH